MPTKKIYKCVECGKEFEATQTAKYCSPACKVAKQNRKKVVVECVVCGTLFEAMKTSRAHFCSRKCSYAAAKDVRENPDSIYKNVIKVKSDGNKTYTRRCISCGNQFETKSSQNVNRRCPTCMQQYKKLIDMPIGALADCDLTLDEMRLYAEANNIDVIEPAAQPSKSSAQNYVKQNQSREEYNANRRRNRALKKALGLLPNRDNHANSYRNTVLSQRPAVCEICGYCTHTEAIQVHHIDADRSNNADDNLVVICSNCHSIIHTRARKHMSTYADKKEGIISEFYTLQQELTNAEVKDRN